MTVSVCECEKVCWSERISEKDLCFSHLFNSNITLSHTHTHLQSHIPSFTRTYTHTYVLTQYCKSLQMAGLSVSMSPDDDFESDDDVE